MQILLVHTNTVTAPFDDLSILQAGGLRTCSKILCTQVSSLGPTIGRHLCEIWKAGEKPESGFLLQLQWADAWALADRRFHSNPWHSLWNSLHHSGQQPAVTSSSALLLSLTRMLAATSLFPESYLLANLKFNGEISIAFTSLAMPTNVFLKYLWG